MVEREADRGQALPAVIVVVMVAMALVVFAARLAVVVDDAAQARTAADAAALAGAAGGEGEARELAEANGATLVSFSRTGRVVEVVVSVGEVRARAQAQGSVMWVRRPG